jgi:signal transduction histidine kinase
LGLLRAFLEERPFVLDRGKVFLRYRRPGDLETRSKYLGYPVGLWADYLERHGLQTTESTADSWCLLREGNACWKALPSARAAYRQWILIALMATFGGLSLVLLALVVQKIRRARRERQARLFALQTLTHELRTPAATLGLCVDGMKRHFDALPESAQTDLLRMCDEVQRLGRVLQASTQYLKSHRDPGHIQFELTAIDSLNGYFGGLLEPYRNRIAFEPLREDAGAKVDRYWLGLCVKNLVDNALAHGKPPVTVTLKSTNEGLVVDVSDSGHCSRYDLNDLMAGLSRDSGSRGLGIGLSIVAKVADLMNGRLTLNPSPTTFPLLLRGAL